jgi:Fe-Mn family superoxide dismutase
MQWATAMVYTTSPHTWCIVLVPDLALSLRMSVSQVWNHTFFWESMKPNGGGEPTGKLADAIKASFGSLDEFKTQFKAAGGWLLLTVGDLIQLSPTRLGLTKRTVLGAACTQQTAPTR